jgi:hypothetical protein
MTERRAVVEAFCEECVWARSIRTHYAALFEANEKRRELLSEVANIFFHDLNLVLIDYILLQQCKLTDPAYSGKDRRNLTTNYILELDWSEDTRQVLNAKNSELMNFRARIVEARRKLIAHLDLGTRVQSIGLGEFSEAQETSFWAALQAFVDAAHSEAIGGPYEIDATMVDGDVESLIHSLKEAVDYNDLVESDPLFLRRRVNQMRYKDA